MSDDHILHSGGAPGADSVFGVLAEGCGLSEQHYSFRGHRECRTRGRVILTPAQLALADEDLRTVLGDAFTRDWQNAEDPSCPRRLHYWRRNWYQVALTTQVFAVVNDPSFLDFTKDPPDGEGIALAIALFLRQPRCRKVCVYLQVDPDPCWLRWPVREGEPPEQILYQKSVFGQVERTSLLFARADPREIVLEEGDFTGIGTRQLTLNGISAVQELFARSFPDRS